MGYGLLKRACRGHVHVMQREGMSTLTRAQTEHISFFISRARMCKQKIPFATEMTISTFEKEKGGGREENLMFGGITSTIQCRNRIFF